MEKNYKDFLLISANIGSTFEYPERLFKTWIDNVTQTVKEREPLFIAIHCQEVGGKNYEDSMQYVDKFMKMLLKNPHLAVYNKARIYLDEDFTVEEKFTALGSMYFIHESILKVEQWDFVDNVFISVESREVFSANIEHIPHKLKEKFPLEFFPENKWSRKGFIQTRWKIFDFVFDFVNIHLFHDICNLLPLIKDPTSYSSCRNKALRYSLSKVTNNYSEKVPLFIFGDFNFRLNTQKLIKKLIEPQSTVENIYKSSQSKTDEIKRIVYRNNELLNNNKEDKIISSAVIHNGFEKESKVLEIGRKTFNMFNNNQYFITKPLEMFKEFDDESNFFLDYLTEFKINFPPSYPFSEEENVSQEYMNTRCPSWCDRIFLNPEALKLVNNDCSNGLVEYQIIGLDSCMGDHKPVYLSFRLKDAILSDSFEISNDVTMFNADLIDVKLDIITNHDTTENSNESKRSGPVYFDKSLSTPLAGSKTKNPILPRRKYNSVVNQDFQSNKRQSIVDSINGIPATLNIDRCNEQWNIFDNAKFDKETELDIKFRLSHRPYGAMSYSANELYFTPDSPTRTAQDKFIQAARNIKLAENVIAAFRQSTYRKRKISDSSSEDENDKNKNCEVDSQDVIVESKYIVPQTSNSIISVDKTVSSKAKKTEKKLLHGAQCCIIS